MVIVVGSVIEAGKVKVIGFPSDPVRVVTLDAEADGEGLNVNVCPSVVTVVGPVTEAGKVKVTGVPDGPVSVMMLDCEEEGNAVVFPVTVLGVWNGGVDVTVDG